MIWVPDYPTVGKNPDGGSAVLRVGTYRCQVQSVYFPFIGCTETELQYFISRERRLDE